MFSRSTPAAVAAFAALLLAAGLAQAPARAQDAPKDEPVPKFDAAYLTNPANIKIGEGVWQNQCRHCHGNAAYPGKAPKLNPGSYEPDFIYDRVTNGFRKMPAWKEVFSVEERKGIVAYIKSSEFSP
jgi:mono/diheme cytochrome c family protein